jgi:hypothetical protein
MAEPCYVLSKKLAALFLRASDGNAGCLGVSPDAPLMDDFTAALIYRNL